MTTATTTTPAGTARELVATSQRLMDGLLAVEGAAFAQLDAGIQRTADATRERIAAAHHISPTKLQRAELLPEQQWLAATLLPPIAELIAVARERALTVAMRQMQLLAGHTHSSSAPRAGRAAAANAAADVERLVYLQATDSLIAAAGPVRAAIIEQRRTWTARHEPLDALTARICSAERVGLPGATRGVVWQMRAGLHTMARAASVDTCNALLIAAMRGWNDHDDAT